MQSKRTHNTHTCPTPSFHRCSVNLSTCPRTRRQWAACTDRTRLRSYEFSYQQHEDHVAQFETVLRLFYPFWKIL